MGLEAVFAAFAPLIDDSVKFGGPEDWSRDKAPPAITWMPLSAKPNAPQRIGGGPKDDGDLYSRQVAVAVRIWGETFAQAEALLVQFVNVGQRLYTQRSFLAGEEEWRIADTVGGWKGTICSLVVFVNVPLPRTQKPTQTITAITATYKLGEETMP
jgi:hypothetical protein